MFHILRVYQTLVESVNSGNTINTEVSKNFQDLFFRFVQIVELCESGHTHELYLKEIRILVRLGLGVILFKHK